MKNFEGIVKALENNLDPRGAIMVAVFPSLAYFAKHALDLYFSKTEEE